MRIEIKSIDPVAIRYETCGDWIPLTDGSLQVLVPEYGNENSAFLVALHELVEAWLCRVAHIDEEAVSKFDIEHPELEEPGDSMHAPYHKQHMIATQVERDVCNAMGLDWHDHNAWVGRAADEVSHQIDVKAPRILIEGSRYWAELHLFALRHDTRHQCVNNTGWLADWVSSLPFDNCPCKGHLQEFLAHNPPDWKNFFKWTVDLHNAVNARIGKLTISPERARELWMQRKF